MIRETLKESVKQLALRNLDQEPILNSEKAKLQQTFEEVKRLTNEYKSIKQQYGETIPSSIDQFTLLIFFAEEQIGEMNPEMLWILLQSAASELERQTEVRRRIG